MTEERKMDAQEKKLVAKVFGRLSSDWEIEKTTEDGAAVSRKNLFVIFSVNHETDGKYWLHLSVSRSDSSKVPSYEDLVFVKKTFVGDDAYAYQVFPPKTKHVNLHPGVLHLWHCFDGHVIPEFSRVVAGQRTI